MHNDIKEKIKLIPEKPGCYLMKDHFNEIIYVGKAKKLKNRVNSYFRGKHYGKTAKLVSEIDDFEYIVTSSKKALIKRLKEEAIKDRKYASQKVVGELINPIDMLVKVINFGSPNPEIQNYLYGFKMIADKLVDILKTEGLGEVVALNQKFDPKTMEAMSVVENDELEEDTVVEVKQTGYTYKDRLIRPAMVVVSKKTKKNEEIIEERKEEE